jgi:hypothetical protein
MARRGRFWRAAPPHDSTAENVFSCSANKASGSNTGHVVKNPLPVEPPFMRLCSKISHYEIGYRNLKIKNSLIKCVVHTAGRPYIRRYSQINSA